MRKSSSSTGTKGSKSRNAAAIPKSPGFKLNSVPSRPEFGELRHAVKKLQKDSEEPLVPGDIAMMIGDYQPRLVKAPQEVIDSAQPNSPPSRVKVNQGTGEILFDDELNPHQSQGEEGTRPMSQQDYEGGTWVEPKTKDPGDPNNQQQ